MDTSSYKIEKFSKYLLVEQIASGGMAVIYKAMAKMSDQSIHPFAIKRILPQHIQDQEFISLLHDEAKLMVQLNHPNIVSMVEFGKHSDQYYIAMEFIDGITLKDLMNRVKLQESVFTTDMATHIIREIAIGLSYAHRKKDKKGRPLHLVHRDISPANILLSYQGDVKIADFGISKAQSQNHKTQAGIIRGKIGYMSPEQTRSDLEIDHRSDLYSLGIIFYELLTGIRLFSANTIPEAIKMVREGSIPPPTEVRKDIPKALEHIILKILHQDREKRYQHAQDIVDDLNEFLVQHAPLGRPMRISHVDLMGFIKRFFKKEIAKSANKVLKQQEFEKIIEEESKPQKIQYEISETFAANPMFELSKPETTIKEQKQVLEKQKALMKEHGYVPIRDEHGNPISASNLTYDEPTKTENKIWQHKTKLILSLPFIILILGIGYFMLRKPPSSGVVPPNVSMKVVKNPMKEMVVDSVPSSANIFVDNQDTGKKTPAEVHLDLRKPVELKLVHDGYIPIEKTITRSSYKEEIKFVMDATKDDQNIAQVSLTSEPPGANILINGVNIDQKTPATVDLEQGKIYNLTFVKKGYETRKTSVDVRSSAKIQKNVFLNQVTPKKKVQKKSNKKIATPSLGTSKNALKTGELNIITVPWSYVYINGKKIRETPLTNFQIQAGTHKVLLSNKAQKVEDYTLEVTVKEGKKTICSYQFVENISKCRIE